MPSDHVQFEAVQFSFDSMAVTLFESLSFRFPPGWTGLIGRNGAGKTTVLRLATGDLLPWQGRVIAPPDAAHCAQRTDAPPDQLSAFVTARDAHAARLAGRLAIGEDWGDRWSTLSQGERKRAQIGVALWRRTRVLALDEPTNHLDVESRLMLIGALRSFRGVGLLVSHDRELLDALCSQCLFVEPPGAELVSGGYSQAVAQRQADRDAQSRAHDRAKREVKRLEREQADRRREAARADRRRSKRGLARKDRDARSRIDAARVSGRDGHAGRLQSQLGGRIEQARRLVADSALGKERGTRLVWPGTPMRSDRLFCRDAGAIELGEDRRLEFPELRMRPTDRVGLVGPNGAGKSTLLRHLVERFDLPSHRFIYVPQELTSDAATDALRQVRELPDHQLGDVLTVLASLGSDPVSVLETERPSPGEVQKLLLGLGVARAPSLIVMDEPTNHLDLPAVERLEAALADWPGALLLVSHDRRFLDRLVLSHWRIGPIEGQPARMRLDVVR